MVSPIEVYKDLVNGCHNFADLSYQESAQLAEVIDQEKGEVVSLVHPFFHLLLPDFQEASLKRVRWNENVRFALKSHRHDHVWTYFTKNLHKVFESHGVHGPQLEKSHRKYFQKLTTFLRSTQRKALVLAERASLINDSLLILRALGYQGHILAYQTLEDGPTPSEGSYSDLIDASHRVGIKRFLVGGQNIYWKKDFVPYEERRYRYSNEPVEIDSSATENVFGGCIYGFILGMSKIDPNAAIRYILSPVSWPQWRPEELSYMYSED